MPGPRARLRRDLTPCLLHTDLFPDGGGLARAVPERASLYARHFARVLVLTTGFSPGAGDVVRQLKERGSLDERVVVRNFFADSTWANALGTPPDALVGPGDDGSVATVQRLRSASATRLADTRPGERFAFRYRYFDAHGRLRLTTGGSPQNKYDRDLRSSDGTQDSWSTVVGRWVDEEVDGLPRPVLFSLQRGLVDPVLLATTRASRKVVSLHNCHYRDPLDVTSGVRPTFRPVLRPGAVDEVVCLTEQQRRELAVDAPRVLVRAIPYPGRVPGAETPTVVDDKLVVLVARLEDRKRVDHALRAFVRVVEAVPDARLEVYGAGPAEPTLSRLVTELGLGGSVRLMGYSHQVGEAQARALCTLMTSTFEGFARVISESMSRGTPVVSYDVRYGPRDLIRDGVDGVLVTRHEPEALADAVVALLRDPARAHALGARAREVLDRFPVEDFERAWLRVLSPRPRPLRVVVADWRARAEPARRRLAGLRVRAARLGAGLTPTR